MKRVSQVEQEEFFEKKCKMTEQLVNSYLKYLHFALLW